MKVIKRVHLAALWNLVFLLILNAFAESRNEEYFPRHLVGSGTSILFAQFYWNGQHNFSGS